MKSTHVLLFATLLFLGVSAVAQTNALLPQPPAIWREVTGITNTTSGANPVVTRPHVPAFRITRDGRVGLRVISGVGFALLMPEKLTNFVLQTQNAIATNNSYVMSSTTYMYANGSDSSHNPTNFYRVATNSLGGLDHVTLYDPTPEFPMPGETVNPTNINGNDVYHLTVIAAYDYATNDPTYPNKVQFFATPVTLTVTNPKTANASISSLTAGTPVVGPSLGMTEFREPNVVGDGRLIVMRGANALPWVDPDTGVRHPSTGGSNQSFDICYSYYTNGAPCDVNQWTNIIPITHAPYDTRINNLFGFAMQPFRDAAGTLIRKDADIAGTYPWIDRDAKNLFFTVVSDTLRYSVVGNWNNTNYSRYGQTNVPEDALTFNAEEASPTRGICFAGLWSHGKMVMIDNLNNDTDYAMDDGNHLGERMVHLFNSNSGVSMGSKPDWLRLGAGRVNSDSAMPKGDNRNSTVIDSVESALNYRKFAVPTTVGDVVWPLHNAKNSDDLMFDDFVDPNGFIVANMAGATTFSVGTVTKSTGNTNYNINYYNGWNSTNHSWDQPVRLQNAATATTNYWAVPTDGLVIGTASSTPAGRLEPAATGGIHGKGFWLTGSNGLQFTVGSQPQNVSSNDWYAGIFVDCRFPNDNTARVLLTFPDGSSIRLIGRKEIRYFNTDGTTSINTINLPAYNASSAFPDMMPTNGWAHLAWQIRNGGKAVDFLLNGLLYDSYTPGTAIFQLTPGNLTVGQPASSSVSGFNGWIDDFIILAHTLDPESACNHAGGTLVGLPDGYAGYLMDFATNFPASTHVAISNLLVNNGQTAYPNYANYYNYTKDYAAHLGSIPTGAVSLRQAIHFPEGPLFWNAPRPNSTKNQFCLTCHTSDGLEGLTPDALMLHTNVNADADDRRQPFQPFARVFGNIPTNFVDSTSLPSSATNASGAGQYIDDWLLQTFTNVTVKTYTLVDATHNVDLTPLNNGDTVNLASYPAPSYAIRANLDSEQGSVTLTYKGQGSVTNNVIPYSITLSNIPAGFSSHSLTAVPSKGATNTISFYFNN